MSEVAAYKKDITTRMDFNNILTYVLSQRMIYNTYELPAI